MKKDLAVILIITHKTQINQFEEISLRQCFSVLGDYPIRLVCPRGLDISTYRQIIPQVEVDFIDPSWLSTYQNFNKLKVRPLLYQKYQKYEFILFYELDAFVFRDDLKHWCAQGYDYIGAPWFDNWTEATVESPAIGVGNGGFSLRNVDKALKALHTFSYLLKPAELWDYWQTRGKPLHAAASLLKNCTYTNNSFFLLNHFSGNAEDFFWGGQIARNFDWFHIPSISEASKFSFEANSKILFEENSCCLPFGCHGWWKHEFDFWLPHIKNCGYLQ